MAEKEKVTRTCKFSGVEEFVSFDEALEKLSGFYRDLKITEEALRGGTALGTPSAIYQIKKEGENG